MPTQHLAENRAKRRILGATLAITAIAACWLPPLGTGNERGLPWGGVYACFGAVVAMGLLLPDFLQAILRWARPFARNQRGPAWQLALGGLAAGRQRLGVPLAALAGTLALSAAIAIMVDSFRTTLNYWISTTLAADIYLRPASKVSGSTESYISAEVVSELANHADVASMEELRLMDVPFRGSKILLSVSNFASMATRGTLAMRGMQSPKELLANASGSSRVFVSEAFARRFNHNEGDEFLLPTGNGDQTITIAGVFYDYSNDRGTVMLDRTFFEQTYGPFHATNVAAYVKPGVDASTTVEQLRQGIGTLKAVEIFSNAGLRQEILRIFDKTFAITWTLEIIALLVAMASVATTIFTLILERKEELRTLSQLGTSAKQLRRAFGIEGFLLGIVSQVGGLILGLLLSLVLIYVINVQSFGWTIRFHPPWAMLLGSAVLAPLATALAAMLASRAMFTLGLMK